MTSYPCRKAPLNRTIGVLKFVPFLVVYQQNTAQEDICSVSQRRRHVVQILLVKNVCCVTVFAFSMKNFKPILCSLSLGAVFTVQDGSLKPLSIKS